MDKGFAQGKDLLDAEDIAGYLRVSPVTVSRWYRDGGVPCLKIGRCWPIRRWALEYFLHRLDAASFRFGEARGGGR